MAFLYFSCLLCNHWRFIRFCDGLMDGSTFWCDIRFKFQSYQMNCRQLCQSLGFEIYSKFKPKHYNCLWGEQLLFTANFCTLSLNYHFVLCVIFSVTCKAKWYYRGGGGCPISVLQIQIVVFIIFLTCVPRYTFKGEGGGGILLWIKMRIYRCLRLSTFQPVDFLLWNCIIILRHKLHKVLFLKYEWKNKAFKFFFFFLHNYVWCTM